MKKILKITKRAKRKKKPPEWPPEVTDFLNSMSIFETMLFCSGLNSGIEITFDEWLRIDFSEKTLYYDLQKKERFERPHIPKIKKLVKKHKRITFKGLKKHFSSLDSSSLLTILKGLARKGEIVLQPMIFCADCGADLKPFTARLEKKKIRCFACREVQLVEPMINVEFFVYEKKEA